MSVFEDRYEAGQLLAKRLDKYKNNPDVIVLGLPRGGVPLAFEIAKYLHKPLGLLFAHKLSHPLQKEYAIGAVSEFGSIVLSPNAKAGINPKYLEEEKARVLSEIETRKALYLTSKTRADLKNKCVILVDDGVATGLTVKAAIKDLKSQGLNSLILAIPVCPGSTGQELKDIVDEFICLSLPSDDQFLGSVGAYYRNFSQVDDDEVKALMKESQ